MDVSYDTVLKCFVTYKDEQLIPSYLPKTERTITEAVKSGRKCAYDVTNNVIYYGQESYHCSTELMEYIFRTSTEIMTYAEYQSSHQQALSKLFPDAPVLVQTAPNGPPVSEARSRLASMGVKFS